MSYKDMDLTPITTPFSNRGSRYSAKLVKIYQEKSTPINGAGQSDYGKLFVGLGEDTPVEFVSSLSGMIVAETPGLEIKTQGNAQIGKKSTPKISYIPIDKFDYFAKNEELARIYENQGAKKLGTKLVTFNGKEEEKPFYNFKRCMMLVVKLDEAYGKSVDTVGVIISNFKALENYFDKVEKKRGDLMKSLDLPTSKFTYALENIVIKSVEVDGYYAFDFEIKPYTEKLAKKNNVYLQQPEIIKLRDEGLLGVPQLKGTTDFDSLAQTESTIGQEDQTQDQTQDQISTDELDELFKE